VRLGTRAFPVQTADETDAIRPVTRWLAGATTIIEEH